MGNDYWTYAQRKKGRYPEHTSRGGKWLIFVGSHNGLSVWNKIKNAIEEGSLGSFAKASRAKQCSRGKSPNGVICIYIYDWTDRADVKRIREELRKIGIVRKISYKTDEDTERGIYRTTGSEKISKYYE